MSGGIRLQMGIIKHDYYHAQPIRTVRLSSGQDVDLDPEHDDICDHFPAFPIDAQDVVHLVDGLLVSLYGAKYTDFMIQPPTLRAKVHKSSQGRGWHRPRMH